MAKLVKEFGRYRLINRETEQFYYVVEEKIADGLNHETWRHVQSIRFDDDPRAIAHWIRDLVRCLNDEVEQHDPEADDD